MTTEQLQNSVSTSTVVDAPIGRAFTVFTEGMSSWWPSSHHILEAELAEMEFEPRAGGRIVDRGVDGSECAWARVLVYEPPSRVVFSWDISTGWKREPDPDRCSEVEVRFTADGPNRTVVELEHRALERHGDGWESMRDAVRSDGGWSAMWPAYASAVAA
jgi:uncharacterized protein YndB with AHSA1/START domain